jgi:hypothetical protein
MYHTNSLSGIMPYPITASTEHQLFQGFKIAFNRYIKEALVKCPNFETKSDKA